MTGRWRNIAYVCFLIYVFLWSIYSAWGQSVWLDAFGYGDWVVHYAGGFVRRGFIGQLLVGTFGAANAPLTVFALKTLLFVGFLTCFYAIFRPLLNDTLLFVCLLGPMSVAFSVVVPSAGGRKELLLLTIVALQVFLLTRRPFKPSALRVTAHTALLATALTFVILSHEALAFYCGFPLLLLYLDTVRIRSPRSGLIRVAAIWAWLGVLFLVQTAFRGTLAQSELLCEKLAASAPARCNDLSAISWLGYDTRRALYDVAAQYGDGALYIYTVTALLCALPLWLLIRTSKSEKYPSLRTSPVVLGIAGSVLVTLPTYFMSVDWGRWQYIAVCSTLLVLGYCYRTGILVPGRVIDNALARFAPDPVLGPILGTLLFASAFFYIFSWNAPLCSQLCWETVGYSRQGHLERLARVATMIQQRLGQ